MAAVQMPSSPQRSAASSPSATVVSLVVRLAALAIINIFAFWLALNLGHDGNWSLAAVLIVMALVVNVINLSPNLWPLRWIAPGLVLLVLLAIYPIFYTVYVAFTNFSDGHRYSKTEAIELIQQAKFLPEGGTSYEWELYRNEAGEYALWLTAADGTALFAVPGQAPVAVKPNESGEGPFNDDGLPTTINGYVLQGRRERSQAITRDNIQIIQFGDANNPIGIKGRSQAGAFEKKWEFDTARNALIDRETGTIYTANDTTGDFIAPDGKTAPVGYWVPVGFENFLRVFNDISVSVPLIRVFLWTVGFAFFSVITSFALGLLMALVMNKPFLGSRFIKSFLIIPYAVPGMISILVWRGMLNPNGGIITATMQSLFGWAPPWQQDPGWAKVAIILVNLWLSFPYFMLICSGALQSISTSIYEAAEVDGANAWQKFWKLTLPLLLVAVGPLLIASFIFNFNNYLLIEALFQGGPRMVDSGVVPVGHTDNLISYTFRYAFASGGTRDFGFASAIAIVIFFIVGFLTLVQSRISRRWEEVGENV